MKWKLTAARGVALLAVCGGLGLSGALAGTAAPALAGGQYFVELDTSSTTVSVGSSVTLTATATPDPIHSPTDFLEIYDATTGTAIRKCGANSGCSISVSESSAMTQEYVAYVTPLTSAFPPATPEGNSGDDFVTWTSTGLSVSLTGPVEVIASNGPGVYTATSSVDVGQTPWDIAIYDETTGKRLNVCVRDSTCSADDTPGADGDYIVAFLYTDSLVQTPAFPPPLGAIQASSNVLLSRGFVG